jgi:pimeloyl-ACP methyl ester carboxylesterase
MPRSTPYTDPAELRRLSAPTLVLACEHDPLHPLEFAETWAALIPAATLQQVPSTAVDVPRHRAVVRGAIAAFLRDHDERGR